MRLDDIAFCGLECQTCPAYIATKEDDDEKRRAVAAKWDSPQYRVTADDISCTGCKGEGLRFTWCEQCAVRGCASERGVATCAHCPEYGCDTLEKWLIQAGADARKKLDGIRASL